MHPPCSPFERSFHFLDAEHGREPHAVGQRDPGRLSTGWVLAAGEDRGDAREIDREMSVPKQGNLRARRFDWAAVSATRL